MEKDTMTEYAVKRTIRSTVQEALDMLDADDGMSFEEKKEIIVNHLKRFKKTENLADVLADFAIADMKGQQIKDLFWSYGLVPCPASCVVLRKVEDRDRNSFLAIQQEYCPLRSMLSEESTRERLWKDHQAGKSLMLSIEKEGEYIGYCGIKNTAQDPWEIAIELFPQWTKQGIGPNAISAMLNAVKVRLGICAYRVRINPSNKASQKMFEKLGAVPNGISEFLLHDQKSLEKCEEDNAHLINEDLIALAARFDVEPRKLLSHVLEYALSWT